jgi:hypothetical protein
MDNSHGRFVTRTLSVFDGDIVKHKNYPHLKSFIKVERSGKRGKKLYSKTVYYASSLQYIVEHSDRETACEARSLY